MRKVETESFFSIETQYFAKPKHPFASDEAIGKALRSSHLSESLPEKISGEPHFPIKKVSLLLTFIICFVKGLWRRLRFWRRYMNW